MAYSFRLGYESGAFLQRDLISHEQLAREGKKRGFSIPIGDAATADFFEELDREGSFRPIAFANGPYTPTSYHGLLGRPELTFREELPFRQWSSYRWSEEDRGNRSRSRLTALYSPWQLVFLHRALKFRSFQVPAADLVDQEGTRQLAENAQRMARALLDSLGRTDEDWRRLLLLLVRIQNRYWPFVGAYTLERDPRTHEYIDPVARERRRFSARRVLSELDLTADEVRDYHERLGFFAQQEDPIPEWWVLRRMASRSQRERMKGSTRIVEDIWEATQMLRFFYRQLSRRILPDAHFVGHDPQYERRLLGHERRLYYDQLDLLRFLSRNDFYPHQVHVFVEGESEEILLRMILEAWLGPLDAHGIRFTNLAGIDNLARRHQELFEGFARYARAPVLIADNESDIGRYVETLTAQQLINPEGVWLWRANLEADNFSDADLVRAVRELARERGERSSGLSGRGVRASFTAGLGLPGASTTFVDELIRLAAHPEHNSVRFSKPELARKLGERVLAELETTGLEGLRKKRPILRRAEMIVQLAQGARFAAETDG